MEFILDKTLTTYRIYSFTKLLTLFYLLLVKAIALKRKEEEEEEEEEGI
jgi:hypothetical protein